MDIEEEDDGDSDEIDEDYVPEGGSGGLGESDGEGGEILKEGLGTIQRGQVKFIKRGWVKFRKRGWVTARKEGVGKIHKKGVGKIQKEGAGEIQKEGVGKVHKKGVGKIKKEGVGEIQKEGVGEILKEGGVQGWVRECGERVREWVGWGWEQWGGDPRENVQLLHRHHQHMILQRIHAKR